MERTHTLIVIIYELVFVLIHVCEKYPFSVFSNLVGYYKISNAIDVCNYDRNCLLILNYFIMHNWDENEQNNIFKLHLQLFQ